MNELAVVHMLNILQWFGKHVSCLVIGSNMVNGDASIVHHVSDIVIPDVNML